MSMIRPRYVFLGQLTLPGSSDTYGWIEVTTLRIAVGKVVALPLSFNQSFSYYELQ